MRYSDAYYAHQRTEAGHNDALFTRITVRYGIARVLGSIQHHLLAILCLSLCCYSTLLQHTRDICSFGAIFRSLCRAICTHFLQYFVIAHRRPVSGNAIRVYHLPIQRQITRHSPPPCSRLSLTSSSSSWSRERRTASRRCRFAIVSFLHFPLLQLQSYGGVKGLCAQLRSSPTEGLSGDEADLQERVEVRVHLCY